jgi:hypothetical protein
MKSFIPLAVIMLLLSCGKKSDSKKPGLDFSKYQESLETRSVGDTTVETTEGTRLEVKTSSSQSYFGASKIAVKQKETYVIIHTDGQEFYSFVETKDFMSGSVTKKVYLDKLDSSLMLQELRKIPGAKIVNDRLIFKKEFSEEEVEDQYTLNFTNHFSGSLNLLKPLCDYTLSELKKSIDVISDSEPVAINEVGVISSGTCGPKMSVEEIKKIDLSSIELCDYTSGSEECEENKDLRHLTSDL